MRTLRKLFTVSILLALHASVMALPLTSVYKLKNVSTGKYVRIVTAMMGKIDADQEGAAHCFVAIEPKSDGTAVVSQLKSGNGDYVAGMTEYKNAMKDALELVSNRIGDILDEGFTLRMQETGDADGSVYVYAQVPDIEEATWQDIITEIENNTISLSDEDLQAHLQLLTNSLKQLSPGMKLFIASDADNSFGYRYVEGKDEAKWLMEPCMPELNAHHFIKNIGSGNYMDVKSETFGQPDLDTDTRHHAAGGVIRIEASKDDNILSRLSGQGVDLNSFVLMLRDGFSATLADMGLPSDVINAYVNDGYMRMEPTCEQNSTDYEAGNFMLVLHMPSNLLLPEEYRSEVATIMKNIIKSNLGVDNEVYETMERNDAFAAGTNIYVAEDNAGMLSYILANQLEEYGERAKWHIETVESDINGNYFSPNLLLAHEGKYYGTLYTDFAYTIVNPSVLKAYSINTFQTEGGKEYAKAEDIGQTVPACTAVLFVSTSNQDEDNLLQPTVEDGSPVSGNLLNGVYFDNRQQNNKKSMRVLNKSAADGVGFFPYSKEYMGGNKAWLDISSSQTYSKSSNAKIAFILDDTTTGIAISETAESTEPLRVYDLQGRQTDNGNKQRGIYITGGKKVMISK